MFDGADLSLVYGAGSLAGVPPPPPPPQQPIGPMPELTVPKSTQSHAMPPDPPYAPPSAMYAQQAPVMPPDTFWDRLGQKKIEVFKLVMLAFVILLAISFDRLITYYLNAYTAKAFLTESQEFLVRLAYP